jgi:hypothetical protein
MMDDLTIIKVLNMEYPLGGVKIRGVSAVHFGEHIGYLNQYIFRLA